MKIAVGLAVNVQAQILLSRQIRHRDDAMIDKFTTVYAGHIDMPDRGKEATPANERRFSAEELRGVFGKLERVAIAGDKPFGPNDPYDGPIIDRPDITLSEQDAPPHDGEEPVRNFKR